MSATLCLTPTLDAAIADGVGRVRAFRQGNPFAPVYLLLPRAEAIRQWQRRLGPSIGVRFLQFHALAQVILRQAHRSTRRVHTDEQLQVVAEALAELRERGELTSFGTVADRPGMARAVLDWLREVEAQGISVQQLEAQARRSRSERDHQLAAVYRRYRLALGGLRATDAEGLMRRAARFLGADGALLRDVGLLLVAGFDQFSPVQLDLLAQLCRCVPDCSIYLLWDAAQDPDGLALSRLRQTRADLERALAPLVQPLSDLPGRDPGLVRLGRALFRADVAPDEPMQVPVPVRAVEAPSREAEVRWALREAKRLLHAGTPPGDVALLAQRRDAYERIVTAVAREYGVPVRQELPLSESPPVAALALVLSLAPDFPRRETLDALRSPYVEQHWLSQEQVDRLDRLTRERPVLAGQEQWLEALHRPSGAEADLEDEERAGLPLVLRLPADEVAAIRVGLLGFFAHVTPPAGGTREELTRWLQERLLGLFTDPDDDADEPVEPPSLHLARCCEAEPYRRRDVDALARVTRILGWLARYHPLRPLTWDTYRDELLRRLEVASLPADVGVDGVCFDRLELARHVAFAHVFLLGLSEGEFPSLPPADVFYAEEERRRYPLPLVQRQPADDACLWWQVLAGAGASVTMLRPRFDEGGAPWPPSPYWDAVLAAAPGLRQRVEQVPIAALPPAEDAAGERELLAALAVGGAERVPPALETTLGAARAAHAVWQSRRGWQALGPHEGAIGATDLLQRLGRHYGPSHVWSVSRLTRYGSCPYSFFAEQVLALEALEEPEAGMDALIRGSLLHSVLEGTYRRATAAAVAPGVGSEGEMLACLDAACDEVLAAAPERFGFRPTALWQHERRELRRLLAALIRWECQENGESPRFRPYLQEVRFGFPGGEPPLALAGEGGGLLLHGVIDRIDVDEQGAVQVIDYKSGSQEYSENAVRSGRALQTALYPLAAGRLAPGTAVAESYYLHIPSRRTSGRLSFERDGDGTAIAEAVTALACGLARGAAAGRFPVASDPTACERCDFRALCRVDRIARARARRSAAQ